MTLFLDGAKDINTEGRRAPATVPFSQFVFPSLSNVNAGNSEFISAVSALALSSGRTAGKAKCFKADGAGKAGYLFDVRRAADGTTGDMPLLLFHAFVILRI